MATTHLQQCLPSKFFLHVNVAHPLSDFMGYSFCLLLLHNKLPLSLVSWHTLTGVRISSLGSVHVDSSSLLRAASLQPLATGPTSKPACLLGGKLMPAAGLSTQTG